VGSPTKSLDMSWIPDGPGALTRSRAKKIAMEEAEVHGRMALEHLMQF